MKSRILIVILIQLCLSANSQVPAKLRFKSIYMSNVINSYRFTGDQSPDPDVSYSLRNTYDYTGDVIRGRRSSDNQEQDFSAAEITDGTLATFSQSGDVFVTTIYDQIGTNNVTQSTSSLQPKIVSAGTVITSNGKPAILSDGSDDFMQSPAGVFPSDITGFFNLTVSKHVSGQTHVAISTGAYASSTNWHLLRVVSSRFRGDINFSPGYNDYGGSSRNISLQYIPSDTLQHLHIYRFNSETAVKYQIDDQTEKTDTFEISEFQKFDQEIDFFAYDNSGTPLGHGSVYWQETQLWGEYIDDISSYTSDINTYYSIY